MKLATYRYRKGESYGAVRDDGIVDVPAAWPDGPGSLVAAIAAGQAALSRIADVAAAANAATPLDAVTLLAPVPQPAKVIGLAVNYLEHHREFDRGADMPDDPRRRTTPRPFLMPPTCVIGPNAEIPWPAYSRNVDYEVELAVVIARRARCLGPKDAADAIAGYTIANDISARTATFADGRADRPKDALFDWLHGKWSDGFCPMGPWLVTPEEIGDPQRLDLSLEVNGETRQRSNTRHMIFSCAELVAFVSHLMTLTPGDVIATGTPAGVALATGRWLKGGDVITCRIEGIGELTNTMGQPPAEFYAPCAG